MARGRTGGVRADATTQGRPGQDFLPPSGLSSRSGAMDKDGRERPRTRRSSLSEDERRTGRPGVVPCRSTLVVVDLTPRQRGAAQAHVSEGTQKAPGVCPRAHPRTLTNHLTAVRQRLGVDTTEQAVVVLTLRCELVGPAGSHDSAPSRRPS
jgi:hypothetical protein